MVLVGLVDGDICDVRGEINLSGLTTKGMCLTQVTLIQSTWCTTLPDWWKWIMQFLSEVSSLMVVKPAGSILTVFKLLDSGSLNSILSKSLGSTWQIMVGQSHLLQSHACCQRLLSSHSNGTSQMWFTHTVNLSTLSAPDFVQPTLTKEKFPMASGAVWASSLFSTELDLKLSETLQID